MSLLLAGLALALALFIGAGETGAGRRPFQPPVSRLTRARHPTPNALCGCALDR
jgi:hypothetical protein